MEKDENNNIYQDVPAEGREGILKDICYSFEEKKIQKPFSPNQLEEFKEKLSVDSVELSQILAEKSKTVKEFDAKIKPLQLTVNDAVKNLRNRYEEVDTMVYNVANHTTGMMDSFDSMGHFISSRRLYADEKQIKVATLNTGTNG